MSGLTREQILNQKDFEVKKVDTPEWGDGAFVYIRSFNGHSRSKYEGYCSRGAIEVKSRNKKATEDEIGASLLDKGIRGLMMTLSICDKDGNLLFREEDGKQLEERSSVVVERLFHAITELNGLNIEGEVETVKN